MTKRRKDKHTAYQTLTRAGLDFQNFNHVSPNSGSETTAHWVCKTLCAKIGWNNDYWVGSEVTYPTGHDADLLFWGNPDRLTYVVETETGWTEETKTQKREQYVEGYPVDDMLTVEVTDMPMHILDALEYVSDELGLSV